MDKKEIIGKIMEKKEFSQLPLRDVTLAFEQFDKKHLLGEEKVKKTRDLLRKVYSGFTSQKLLSMKDKNQDWILRKHLSTRERFEHYKEIYAKVFENLNTKPKAKGSVIDFGAGVNGLSYRYFPKSAKVSYVGIEAVGQFVELMKRYFKKTNIDGKVHHLSLLELEKVKDIVSKTKKPRVVFMLKVIDSLEALKRNYSKRLILELAPFVDLFVASFATKTMVRRGKIWAKRTWFKRFLNENFRILDEFEVSGERYFIFSGK